jgi:TonB family protein
VGAGLNWRLFLAAALAATPLRLAADPAAPPVPAAPTTDILAYYPPAAKAAGVGGSATVECGGRTEHGGIVDCKLVSESPHGQGFADAALAMTAKAVENPKLDLAPDDRGPMKITFTFTAAPPGIHPDVLRQGWMDMRPVWTQPRTVADDNYPRAALRSGARGHVTLTCKVGDTGRFSECLVIEETPQNLGFGQAALKLASRVRMGPITADGIWTAGASIIFPLNFVPPLDDSDGPAPVFAPPPR